MGIVDFCDIRPRAVANTGLARWLLPMFALVIQACIPSTATVLPTSYFGSQVNTVSIGTTLQQYRGLKAVDRQMELWQEDNEPMPDALVSGLVGTLGKKRVSFTVATNGIFRVDYASPLIEEGQFAFAGGVAGGFTVGTLLLALHQMEPPTEPDRDDTDDFEGELVAYSDARRLSAEASEAADEGEESSHIINSKVVSGDWYETAVLQAAIPLHLLWRPSSIFACYLSPAVQLVYFARDDDTMTLVGANVGVFGGRRLGFYLEAGLHSDLSSSGHMLQAAGGVYIFGIPDSDEE